MLFRYIAGRVAQLVPVLFLISVMVFSIMHALPGDPVQLMLAGSESGSVTPERQDELRELMGLNDPLPVQYLRFVRGAVTGDLGTSVRLRSPVLDLILERFGSTLELSLGGIFFAVLIGMSTGILAAMKQGSWMDTISMMMAYIGVSLPLFWLGLLLILVFSFWLGWFPPAGQEGLRSSDFAQHHPGSGLGRCHQPLDPVQSGGGIGRGLYAHGPFQRSSWKNRHDSPRATECLSAGSYHTRPAVRRHACGYGRDRDGLQPSRIGSPGGERHFVERLSSRPRHYLVHGHNLCFSQFGG